MAKLDPAAAPPVLAPVSASPAERVQVDGKFFLAGASKFHPKGVTYGPFKPDAAGFPYPSPEQVARDFAMIRRLNSNSLRLYYLPPPWLLDLAQQHGLKVLLDCNWSKHTCFLDDRGTAESARRLVRETAEAVCAHPAVLGLVLVNEIPPDIARWYGPARVCRFIDELAEIVKRVDPHRLVTFANFPSTEFLQPENLDFASFNLYLHDPRAFANYLDRLQSIAGGKPLVLSEFGMDSLRHGEEAQAQFLGGHVEWAFRLGLAGVFVFAFTDDWFTGGFQIENWAFGVTDRERRPRHSFQALAAQYAQAPYFSLATHPRVSIVVASYNGGRTLSACLDSLTHLNYPNYEVILVDDGSTDDSARVAAHYPSVRVIVHPGNRGLSAARNTGIAAATGEIVAFTDSDCRADEDWLHYLVGDLLRTDACAIGGHNFSPPDEGAVAKCVAVAPGGPAHVMIDDRNAEHVPGCNMAFWKWALEEIEGFDPMFRAAGDDVDVCWRLQQLSRRIAFSHSGFVWHYRRNTVMAYLHQQAGYGLAEAMLQFKHPEYFNRLGGMRWRGRIYGSATMSGLLGRFVIYHGIFGSGLFQTLYRPEPIGLVSLFTSLEWHFVVTFGLFLLGCQWHVLFPLALLSLLLSLASVLVVAAEVPLLPRHWRWWSRPLVAALYLLQPIVRGWPRYARRLVLSETPASARQAVRKLARRFRWIRSPRVMQYWSEDGQERLVLLQRMLEVLDTDRWQSHVDCGWDDYDVVIYGDRMSQVNVKTVCENHGGNKRLFRVSLSAHWSFLAKVAFALFAADAIVVRGLAATHWWSDLSLLVIPLLVLYLQHRTLRTLHLGAALVDFVARENGLTPISPERGRQSPCTSTDG